jgi:hypothetical protein
MQATPPASSHQRRPVVVVLGVDDEQTQYECERWRTQGAVVMQTSGPAGCLRVATSVRPDVLVLDRRVPDRLLRLLRAHPVSSSAEIQWLPPFTTRVLPQAA